MNVLELVQAAASEMGIQVPTSLLATTDTAVQWRNILYAVSRELRRSRAFPQQKRTAVVSLEANRRRYPFPEDFWSALLGTGTDRSTRWQLVGPVSDEEMNYRLYGPGRDSSRLAYRVIGYDRGQGSATLGGQMELDPLPAASSTISYDYCTATMFLPPRWQSGETLALNDERNANGNIYRYTSAGSVGTTAPSHSSGTTNNWEFVTAPKETIRTNADLSLWDDEVLIEGIKYRYKAASNQDFSVPYSAFSTAIGKSRSRMLGPTRGTFNRRSGPRLWRSNGTN